MEFVGCFCVVIVFSFVFGSIVNVGLSHSYLNWPYMFTPYIYIITLTHQTHMHTAQNITDQKTQRQTGRQAQLSNIAAARAVADIIRTTLGPRSMLKVSPCLVYFAFLFPLSRCINGESESPDEDRPVMDSDSRQSCDVQV